MRTTPEARAYALRRTAAVWQHTRRHGRMVESEVIRLVLAGHSLYNLVRIELRPFAPRPGDTWILQSWTVICTKQGERLSGICTRLHRSE